MRMADSGRRLQNRRRSRVILLLDLDCFYAQCECVRLGYDVIKTPLALLQWNSVLAVTYPAREIFGVKRGDSWDEIQKKVRKANDERVNTYNDNPEISHCHTVQVPILTTASSNEQATKLEASNSPDSTCYDNDSTTNCISSTIENEYEQIFCLSQSEQEITRRAEMGLRRYSNEGKASIERYRVASRRIFDTVLEWIDENYGSDKIELERASVDEFFLDVTEACTDSDFTVVDHALYEAMRHTKVIGQDEINIPTGWGAGNDGSDADINAMNIGCHIAYSIRTRIFERLGFTLSAGISCNKTLAKLSTTYGKPNGQAVTFTNAIEYLLNDTQIRKCRNLGGKLGKTVLAALPPNAPTTVGSVAKYLSLPDLQKLFPNTDGTARWVYDIARGIDQEEVLSKNESAIPKSITCFKALPFQAQGHSLLEASSWIRILANELVSRVEKDSIRHKRYPRTCNVQYASISMGRRNKSVRMHFPPQQLLSCDCKIEVLTERVPKLIHTKEGNDFKLSRIGLCAVDFVAQVTTANAIASYFSVNLLIKNYVTAKPPVEKSLCEIQKSPSDSSTMTNEHRKRSRDEHCLQKSESRLDSDYEIAKKLQASFHLECCRGGSIDNNSDIISNDDKVARIGDSHGSENNATSQDLTTLTTNVTRIDNVDATTKSGCYAIGQTHDLRLARKLQATYDSEYRIIGTFEKRDSKSKDRTLKSKRIDNFFRRK
jgi:nucleotidyltransferase/DNA polymerase involved in DNA repair